MNTTRSRQRPVQLVPSCSPLAQGQRCISARQGLAAGTHPCSSQRAKARSWLAPGVRLSAGAAPQCGGFPRAAGPGKQKQIGATVVPIPSVRRGRPLRRAYGHRDPPAPPDRGSKGLRDGQAPTPIIQCNARPTQQPSRATPRWYPASPAQDTPRIKDGLRRPQCPDPPAPGSSPGSAISGGAHDVLGECCSMQSGLESDRVDRTSTSLN